MRSSRITVTFSCSFKGIRRCDMLSYSVWPGLISPSHCLLLDDSTIVICCSTAHGQPQLKRSMREQITDPILKQIASSRRECARTFVHERAPAGNRPLDCAESIKQAVPEFDQSSSMSNLLLRVGHPRTRGPGCTFPSRLTERSNEAKHDKWLSLDRRLSLGQSPIHASASGQGEALRVWPEAHREEQVAAWLR